jgi:cysteine desulfurase
MGYIDYAAARPRPAEDCVVYLDHAATTPMLPEALAAMTEELGQLGNPSSLHNAGRRARRVVEESREQIAEVFGARPSEVIFTSGGTEADNLAVKGLYWARVAGSGQSGSGRPGSGRPAIAPHRVLATAIEHHAVLDSVHWLAGHEEAEEHWLPVDDTGVLQPAALAEAIGDDPDAVALITVTTASRSTPTPSRRPGSCRSTSRPPARTR